MFKRLLVLRYVCKKYNLKFDWVGSKFFKDEGCIFSYAPHTEYTHLQVPLFNKHFYSILFHEVGHLVAHRTLNFTAKHCHASEVDYKWGVKHACILLAEEAKASKFSMRVLKGKDKKFLKECWYGYTAWVRQYHTNEGKYTSYTDFVAKYANYFED